MEIKSLGKKFQKKFFENKGENDIGEKDPEELVQEEVINPIQNKDLTIQQQADKIIKILEENPEHSKAIMDEVAKSDKISQQVLDVATIKATDSTEVPVGVAKLLAKEATDAPTLHFLRKTIMPIEERAEINATIDEEENKIKAQRIGYKKLYNNLKDMEDVIALPEKIMKLQEGKREEKVNDELYELIAKSFAVMYYKLNKAMNITLMEKIIPVDEMMRAKIPEKIEEEYLALLGENEKNKYDKEDVTNIFLDRIAKETSEDAKRIDSPIELFAPTDLGELSEKEIEKYLDYLNKYNPNLTAMARGNIKDRLQRKEKVKSNINLEQQFLKGIGKLSKSERQRYLSSLTQLDIKEIDTVVQFIESGLVNYLSNMKPGKREKYLEVIKKSVEKRKNNRRTKETSKTEDMEETKVATSEKIENQESHPQTQGQNPTSPGEDDEYML